MKGKKADDTTESKALSLAKAHGFPQDILDLIRQKGEERAALAAGQDFAAEKTVPPQGTADGGGVGGMGGMGGPPGCSIQ
jgi:hypothetical protein